MKVTFAQRDPIPLILNLQLPLDDIEQFIFVIVLVPGKFAEKLGHLHILIIHLPNHAQPSRKRHLIQIKVQSVSQTIYSV